MSEELPDSKVAWIANDGQVFAYKLCNGTHVLVHRPPLEVNSLPAKVDVDMPLLFLEDSPITLSNGDINVSSIQLSQVIGDQAGVFIPSDISITAENILTDVSVQVPTLTENPSTSSEEPPPSYSSISADFIGAGETVDQNSIEDIPEEVYVAGVKGIIVQNEEGNGDGEYIEVEQLAGLVDFMDVVTKYRCRICPFEAADRARLLEHFKESHLGVKMGKNSNTVKAIEENPSENNNESEISEGTVPEKYVYVCSHCQFGFSSLAECKTHMINDHQLVVTKNEKKDDKAIADNPSEESSDLQTSQKLLPKLPRLLRPPPSRVKTEMDDGCAESSPKVPTTEQTEESASKRMKGLREVLLQERKIWCSVRGCVHKFVTNEGRAKHLECHEVLSKTSTGISKMRSQNFKCCYCQEKFGGWRPCASHLWKAHQVDADLFTCPDCQVYKSATLIRLENHRRIHGEVRAFRCPTCGKGFKQMSQLRNHQVVHLDRRKGEEDGLPTRWYTSKKCSICHKSYSDSKCLKKHIQAVHSKLRPYVCHVCGHMSARKAMLQMHLRQHTGEKPFKCDTCDFRTGDHNSLRRHRMRHTGERPYRCPYCCYAAIQSSAYRNHIRTKHSGSKEAVVNDRDATDSSEIEIKEGEEEVSYIEGGVAEAQVIYQSLEGELDKRDPSQIVFPPNLAS
ncbi:zinc finger and BTB domain-containing protein 24-like [Hetaerina americana]|uniref:zinc finger and BTB domain-containing protein 24-like n=1 Tax=Hetaerina americana TaxID=62018 RepID=UPI003A7F3534